MCSKWYNVRTVDRWLPCLWPKTHPEHIVSITLICGLIYVQNYTSFKHTNVALFSSSDVCNRNLNIIDIDIAYYIKYTTAT